MGGVPGAPGVMGANAIDPNIAAVNNIMMSAMGGTGYGYQSIGPTGELNANPAQYLYGLTPWNFKIMGDLNNDGSANTTDDMRAYLSSMYRYGANGPLTANYQLRTNGLTTYQNIAQQNNTTLPLLGTVVGGILGALTGGGIIGCIARAFTEKVPVIAACALVAGAIGALWAGSEGNRLGNQYKTQLNDDARAVWIENQPPTYGWTLTDIA